MAARVGQRVHHAVELGKAAGPAVQQQHGLRVRLGRAQVHEVDRLAIDPGGELRAAVQVGLAASPVVLMRPVRGQPLRR